MSMSISMKKATNKTNINHNNRSMTDRQKERNSHIDYSRSDENKYLVQGDVKKLYEREFGQALQNYNEKQTRSDRKIDDYYKHIEASKKTSVQQEMIIQVGEKEDFTSVENQQMANEILEEWFNDFEERNPQLKVYNAVIHNDEASPHMHLNFVPVADGYKRGLERQVSFDRAIKQQDHTLNKTRPFEDWRANEVQLLENKLQERGIERKLVGANEYKDVNEYKEKKDLEKEIALLREDLSYKKEEVLALNQQFPDEVNVRAEKHMEDVEVPTGEKNIFGKEKVKTEKKPTGNVVIPEEDYKKLVGAAKDNSRLKGYLEKFIDTNVLQVNKRLARENRALKRDLEDKQEENKELHLVNSRLSRELASLKRELVFVYQSTREFLKERTNGLKAFKSMFKELVGKVKDKTTEFQEKHDMLPEKSEFEKLHKKDLNKERDRGMER